MSRNSSTNSPDLLFSFPLALLASIDTALQRTSFYFLFRCTLSQSSQSSPECHLILILLVLLTPLWAFFSFLFEKYSLSMQECSLSFHEEISDKCRKLERSVECQRQGRKWIGIGRVAAARIAAALCRQLRAIHLHLWGITAPKLKLNFICFIHRNEQWIYTLEHVTDCKSLLEIWRWWSCD